MGGEMMVEIRHLTKAYEKLEALCDVSLHVKKGSIYGLIGSNGAGKTTLLKSLVGIYRPDKGEILIDNQGVYENIDIKAKLVFIADALYFFPQFSVKDMANFYKKTYKTWDEERYMNLKNAFNINEKTKIHNLSKGTQKQVAFWLALSIKPEIMVLDEPLDGLDPVMRQKIKNLIVQDVADREMTVLISSHNLRELEDLCDFVGILHKGHLLLEKDLDDLKSDVHKLQIAFKGNISPEIEICGEVLFEEIRGSVKQLIVRGNRASIIKSIEKYTPAILDVLPLTLEEIFMYEMGDAGYEIKNIIF
jgi:ABC-2 type transport system ATP-binding protein